MANVAFLSPFFPSAAALLSAYSWFMTERDTRIIVTTPRLVIRQLTEDDADNLFNLNADPAVMRYLTGGAPTPREEIRDRFIPFHLGVYDRFDRRGTWAAESDATGEFLGWFHFRPGPRSEERRVGKECSS